MSAIRKLIEWSRTPGFGPTTRTESRLADDAEKELKELEQARNWVMSNERVQEVRTQLEAQLVERDRDFEAMTNEATRLAEEKVSRDRADAELIGALARHVERNDILDQEFRADFEHWKGGAK